MHVEFHLILPIICVALSDRRGRIGNGVRATRACRWVKKFPGEAHLLGCMAGAFRLHIVA
jgi:hypothetical protein